MKRLIMITAVTLGCVAKSAEYTYTSGSVEPDDGRIAIKQDGSGNVTELRMGSDDNETLVLTGDALTFAAGAKIVAGQNTNVIENAWTAAGALEFGIEDFTVDVTPLAKDSTKYTTLLADMQLDDLSPVAGVGNSGWSNQACLPYHIRRSSGKMTIEFQAHNSTYIKGVLYELVQDGDDIKGRWVKGGHFGSGNVAYLGWAMFDCPTVAVTDYSPNLKTITLGPRRETYDYTNGLLRTAFDTVVARNVRVEELEILYGGIGYAQTVGTYGRATVMPRHQKFSDGVLSAQMVWSDTSTRTKCVKVELMQSGSDVVARAVYCRRNGTTDEDFDFDDESLKLDSETNPTGWQTDRLYTTYETGNTGSGIDMLALRRKSPSRVAFKVSGEKMLGAVSGTGTEVTFEAGEGGATIDATGANAMTDSAYVIKGDAQNKMVFKADNASQNPLPSGTTDVWGEGTEFQVAKALSSAQSAITMHPGSVLDINASMPNPLVVVLDGATCRSSADRYLSQLTFSNASSVEFRSGKVRACYKASDCVWIVSGTGASTCDATLGLFGNGASETNVLTIAVEDTAVGDAVDFIVAGNITTADARYPYTSFTKTGEGTMCVDGSMTTLTNLPVRVAGGTLVVNSSNALNAQKGAISLEGGSLSFAAGTVNTVADVTLTESAAITLGAGATLTMGSLTVPDGATLALEGDVLNGSVRVTSALDAATLSRITLGGKRPAQSSDGRLCTRGLIISFH